MTISLAKTIALQAKVNFILLFKFKSILISFYPMTINMFTLFREIEGLIMILVYYLIFSRVYIQVAYIQKGICVSE